MDANMVSYIVFVLAGVAGAVCHRYLINISKGKSTVSGFLIIFLIISLGNVSTHVFLANGWNFWPDVVRMGLGAISYVGSLAVIFWNSS